jgi:hypothetical protein
VPVFGYKNHIGIDRERPAGDTEPPDRAFVGELPQQLADRRIAFGQTVEAAVAQPAEQPSLDDQHRDFDLRLVARPPRPCRPGSRYRNGTASRRRSD